MGRLTALRKPNGKIRPIAIGECLRRVAMQVICAASKEDFDSFFTAPVGPPPDTTGASSADGATGGTGAGSAAAADSGAHWVVAMQLGVGSRCGTEIAAKAISLHLEQNPGWAAFQHDFSNAFNAVARRRIVERLLLTPFAHLEPAVRFFFEHTGKLFWEGERLSADSCEGAQQGDPLGSFLIALAFHETLQEVAREFPDVVFVS